VLEDASHAIGASRSGQAVGNCRWSDVTVFSFHPVKIITSGEGGNGADNDEELAVRMKMLRSHGITRDSASFLEPPRLLALRATIARFNYRMTDIHAALGLSQLQRLPEYVSGATLWPPLRIGHARFAGELGLTRTTLQMKPIAFPREHRQLQRQNRACPIRNGGQSVAPLHILRQALQLTQSECSVNVRSCDSLKPSNCCS